MEEGYWAKRKHTEEWLGSCDWIVVHYINDRTIFIYGDWLMISDFDVFGPKLEPPEDV